MFLEEDEYHIPRKCNKCGGVMVFQGVGEYACEDCGEKDFDDYGKVRGYIERHPGANAVEIEMFTGVTQRAIRKMLRDSRLEVRADSRAFLRCDICGKEIRSGKLCSACEMAMHRKIEAEQRTQTRDKSMRGYAIRPTGATGMKRFRREEN
ncbi:MAG: hypothetical protein MJ134_05950 [Lachnospiraceae bacterium]|nr:hypothetical protein [Lachnospiraceae bacterium]